MKIFLSFLCALFVLPCAMAAAELSEVGRVQLEADWLVQCDNQPTAERTQQEIGWTRQLAARIAKMPKAPAFDSQLAKLGAIEKQLQQKKGTAKQLYFAVRRIKREIIFANPVVDFEKVVLIDNTKPRTDHESAHRMGTSGIDGGRLLVTGLQPGGKTVNLFEGKEGAFWRPDVHFDGNKVLVSFKPKGESSFHLYPTGRLLSPPPAHTPTSVACRPPTHL